MELTHGTMWRVEGGDGEMYASADEALLAGYRAGVGPSATVQANEYRCPTPLDVHTGKLANVVWEFVSDHLFEESPCSDENGGPFLGPPVDGPELIALRHALRAVLDRYLDMDEAAWVPTGRVRKVLVSSPMFEGVGCE